MNNQRTGIAIAIAWPEFTGKQAGSWYDPIMRFLGINKNFHYKVGHASLVLIDELGKCHYFDCGRYEAPYQKGRIRDRTTDCGLEVSTKAVLANGELKNFHEILMEIQTKKACKGFGVLKAAYCRVNFDAAYSNVKSHQAKEIVNFGPFVIPGTNCCRFVQNGITKGRPGNFDLLKLSLLFPLWPKPMTIINLLPNKLSLPDRKFIKERNFELFDTTNYYSWENVSGVIQRPKIPSHVPKDSKWLAGEMAGSWFHIRKHFEDKYEIDRFDEDGGSKCTGIYCLTGSEYFDPTNSFSILYPSHCNMVSVEQNRLRVVLNRFN